MRPFYLTDAEIQLIRQLRDFTQETREMVNTLITLLADDSPVRPVLAALDLVR